MNFQKQRQIFQEVFYADEKRKNTDVSYESGGGSHTVIGKTIYALTFMEETVTNKH
ncbi:MAG: hypothetical protein LUE90_05060 [Clostridiales bacterium]|nr:hypothetical protein [Clostridiales bacterium]